MDKYFQVLNKLNQVNLLKGMKLNLSAISQALKLFGNPQNKIKSIHVAGTNGKGSVALKIAKILEYSNFKVGLFTSPHLFSYQERFQINSQYIDKQFVIEELENIFNFIEKHNLEVTFFEILTIMSFRYFLEQKCDIGVFEVGLGGELDATNTIKSPLLSIVTSIGFDHCNSLGYTLESIAKAKAGIIKQNCPVILGPFAQPFSVFQEIAQQRNSKLYFSKSIPESFLDFDLENQIITKDSIDILKKIYPAEFLDKINQENIDQGVQQRQLCRLESISEEIKQNNELFQKPKNIIFDVGHNFSAFERSLRKLNNEYQDYNIKVVVGFSQQKEINQALKTLIKYSTKINVIQANHFRAMPIHQIQLEINSLKYEVKNTEQIFSPVIKNGEIKQNLEQVLSECTEKDVLLITGSFYIMREVREFFGYKDLKDPIDLQEKIVPLNK